MENVRNTLRNVCRYLESYPDGEYFSITRQQVEDLKTIQAYIDRLTDAIVQDAINRNITTVWTGI